MISDKENQIFTLRIQHPWLYKDRKVLYNNRKYKIIYVGTDSIGIQDLEKHILYVSITDLTPLDQKKKIQQAMQQNQSSSPVVEQTTKTIKEEVVRTLPEIKQDA